MIDAVLNILANAPARPIDFESLGVGPVALDLGFFQLRWYSLAYLAGILGGWWYCLKLLAKPGAPMARRHADDMVFYGTLGVILGGRIGYVLFYRPEFYLANLDPAGAGRGHRRKHRVELLIQNAGHPSSLSVSAMRP